MRQPVRLLVTGASGFIGSHLLRALGDTCEVYCVARKAPPGLSGWTRVLPVDLAEVGFARSLPSAIDCVVHLAQSARYRDFPEGATDMRLVNIDGTAQLLEWARRAGVRRFVLASTANVYGESAQALVESDPTRPASFYGASKLAAELLALQYRGHFSVDVLRLFTVYGTGQRGMLIPNIAEKILKGQPIRLADGIGIRLSPIHVDDVVRVLRTVACSSGERELGVLNVCGDEVVSLRDVVDILQDALGTKAVIDVVGGEPAHFVGNNDRLHRCLAWSPPIDLRTGLRRTVAGEGWLEGERG